MNQTPSPSYHPDTVLAQLPLRAGGTRAGVGPQGANDRFIRDATGCIVASASEGSLEEARAIARRLIACVNACAGLATARLEEISLNSLRETGTPMAVLVSALRALPRYVEAEEETGIGMLPARTRSPDGPYVLVDDIEALLMACATPSPPSAPPAPVGAHTAEPWSLRHARPLPGAIPLIHVRGGPNGFFNVTTLGGDDMRVNDAANARRIVACVNACAGIGDACLDDFSLIDFRESAMDVVRNWERGDLAGAVNSLQGQAEALGAELGSDADADSDVPA